MTKNIQLSVPKPCQEKYASFSKTINGGFCASCQKEVIDFTSWSDERLKLYFKNLKGNTCGRFREEQLKAYSYDKSSRTGISWISFVLAGFLLLFSSRQVSGQTAPGRVTEQYAPENNNLTAKPLRRKGNSEEVQMIGVVRAVEQGVPLGGVTVRLKGTSSITMTDSLGRFTLGLPNTESSQTLVFSMNGFKTVEYLHNVARPGREIAVEMRREDMSNIQNALVGVLGGAVVMHRWYEPTEIAREVWWWLRGSR